MHKPAEPADNRTMGVGDWFFMWYRAFTTLRIFGKLGRSLAWIQLCSLWYIYVGVPLLLLWYWSVTALCSVGIRLGLVHVRRSPPAVAQSAGRVREEFDPQHLAACLQNLLSESNIVWRAILLGRKAALEQRVLRLLRTQTQREGRQEHELLLAVEPAAATGTVPSLTCSAATSLVETVATVIAAEILSVCAQEGGCPSAERTDRLVKSHTVAIMVPNSVYYPCLWMGVAHASAVLDALSVATSRPSGSRGEVPQPSSSFKKGERSATTPLTAYTCCSALLNTNIANGKMLSQVISSSGSSVLIMDAAYAAALLFPAMPDDVPGTGGGRGGSATSLSSPEGLSTASLRGKGKGNASPSISLPSSVKKIFLWHEEPVILTGSPTADVLPHRLTRAQLRAIVDYNDCVCTAPRRSKELFDSDLEECSALFLSNLVLFHLYPKSCWPTTSPLPDGRRNSNLSGPPAAAEGSFAARESGAAEAPYSSSIVGEAVTLSEGSADSHSKSSTRGRGRANAASTANDVPNRRTSNRKGSGEGHAAPAASTIMLSPFERQSPLPPSLRTTARYLYLVRSAAQLGHTLDCSAFTEECRLGLHDLLRLQRVAQSAFRGTDSILKIYTSGTTGLPKAAKFTHLRFHAGIGLSYQLDVQRRTMEVERSLGLPPGDAMTQLTVYNCLPMYHSAGGVFCFAHLIACLEIQQRRGCTADGTVPSARMVVRRKFSASNYSNELQAYRVNIVQYIGEVLRYALAGSGATASPGAQARPSVSPPGDAQTRKKVDDNDAKASFAWRVPVAFGNGLRPDVWLAVLERLPIASVVEFYASTEGNVGMMNKYDEPFAVGHMPVFPYPFVRFSPIFWSIFPMKFVVYDPLTEAPKRFEDGLCRCVPVGVEGELVGKVAEGFDPIGIRRFDGYHEKQETKKKIIRDVLVRGDQYFRSGDLLRVDRRGFVSFVDRVGDTFRWKGENVSTLEVANALNRVVFDRSMLPNEGRVPRRAAVVQEIVAEDAVVYGVVVPGCEGRAGMAKLSFRAVLSPTTTEGNRHPSAITTTDVLCDEMLDQLLRERLFSILSDKSHDASLPFYSIPVFLRVVPASQQSAVAQQVETHGTGALEGDMTSTFKHRKIGFAMASFRAAIPKYCTRHGIGTSSQPPANGGAEDLSELDGSRYYVLCSSKIIEVYMKRCAPTTADSTLRALDRWGYIPLSDDVLDSVLGGSFQNCGW